MELRTLRYFLAVVDAGSVTGAAERVHVTQPSLSRQVRGLEKALRFDLFVRADGGRMRLSAAGRDFLPVARDLVARADRAEEAAALIASGRIERVRIAAPGTTLTDVVAPFLAELAADDPLPEVWAEVPVSAYDAFARGADLVVGTAPPPAGLSGTALALLPVWAYVPEGHALAGRGRVGVADLAAWPVLTLTTDFHPRRALDRALDAAGVRLERLEESGTAEIAQSLAAAGRGVAVVSDDPRFGLVPLGIDGPDGPVRVSLFAAWEPTHHAAGLLEDFARRLGAFCVARYGPEAAPTGRAPARMGG